MDVIEQIKQMIAENQVLLFMKGTPDFPQCGFSMRTVEALKACQVEFAYIDILAAPEVRANLPGISNWPTFPQVFVNGELIGGCDIILDLFQKGELQQMLKEAASQES
ncbi:MAG: Grx4 family monothiol glutaredoxin [Gammaproteobacteria bacterium]